MRRSMLDRGWLTNAQGAFAGIALGHDFCAEHESSVSDLCRGFGLPDKAIRIGVEDRTVTTLPRYLVFKEYAARPRDKRRKAVPAALLIGDVFTPFSWQDDQVSVADMLRCCELGFDAEPGDTWYSEDSDLACAWDRSSFGIHVRGDANIAKLKALYEGLLAQRVALASPSTFGFKRTGLSFALVDQLEDTVKQNIRERDLAAQRLEDAVVASGIRERLKAAGKHWYGLGADWFDREKEERLIFFLNPQEQSRYNFGWFTVEDLEAWAQDTGPVVKDLNLEAFSKTHVDWEYHLIGGLAEHGLYLRHHARLQWLDEAKTQVGIFIRPTEATRATLPEGCYPFDELTTRFAKAEAPTPA